MYALTNDDRYYITLVFASAGITGRRGGLIASAVQYVCNVAATVPAIIYIDVSA
jgi:hypothetical protein